MTNASPSIPERRISLVAEKALELNRQSIAQSERFDCEESIASQLFIDGRASLSAVQMVAPLGPFRMFEALLESPNWLGPSVSNAQIERLQAEALKEGVPRPVAQGQYIKWYEGLSELREMLQSSEICDGIGYVTLFDQLNRCAESKFGKDCMGAAERSSPQTGKLTFQTTVQNFVYGPETKFHLSVDASPDWISLVLALPRRKQLQSKLLERALVGGHILTAEPPPGSTLHHPKSWETRRWDPKKAERCWFLCTKDLSDFFAQDDRGRLKREAEDWLKLQVRNAMGSGKRISGEEMKSFLCSRFKLSEPEAKELWLAHRPGNWAKAGRISDEERYNIV